jgi:hypothetical protein
MSTPAVEILSERYHELDKRVSSHEAVCAERYQNLEDGISRVEQSVSDTRGLMLAVAAAVVMQLLAAAAYLFAAWVERG